MGQRRESRVVSPISPRNFSSSDLTVQLTRLAPLNPQRHSGRYPGRLGPVQRRDRPRQPEGSRPYVLLMVCFVFYRPLVTVDRSCLRGLFDHSGRLHARPVDLFAQTGDALLRLGRVHPPDRPQGHTPRGRGHVHQSSQGSVVSPGLSSCLPSSLLNAFVLSFDIPLSSRSQVERDVLWFSDVWKLRPEPDVPDHLGKSDRAVVRAVLLYLLLGSELCSA